MKSASGAGIRPSTLRTKNSGRPGWIVGVLADCPPRRPSLTNEEPGRTAVEAAAVNGSAHDVERVPPQPPWQVCCRHHHQHVDPPPTSTPASSRPTMDIGTMLPRRVVRSDRPWKQRVIEAITVRRRRSHQATPTTLAAAARPRPGRAAENAARTPREPQPWTGPDTTPRT
jgi:hypothetical protein